MVRILSDEAIRQLADDHRRLEEEVRNIYWRLRSFSQLAGDEPKKPFGRATYSADFTSSSESVNATLTHQWGAGQDHTETSIVLHNLLTDESGEYEFYGSEGEACICQYRGDGNNWVILQPQCPNN